MPTAAPIVRAVSRGKIEVRRLPTADQPFGLQFGDHLLVDVESPLDLGDPAMVIPCTHVFRVRPAVGGVGSCGAVISSQLRLVGARLTRVSPQVGGDGARMQIVNLSLHVGVAARLIRIRGNKVRQ